MRQVRAGAFAVALCMIALGVGASVVAGAGKQRPRSVAAVSALWIAFYEHFRK